MKALELINKMDLDLEIDFDNVQDLGTKIMAQTMKKIPKAQNEFLELINEVCETEYTKDSDIMEMVKEIKIHGLEIAKVFQQALNFKNEIS